MRNQRNIAVLGLGYVGLPVALHFSKKQSVIGFDKNSDRIEELKNGFDHTNECSEAELESANVEFTDNAELLKAADFYIIAVPTPIDEHKTPDLTLLKSVSETVGKYLSDGDIVVYESTVYPGVTEEICGPILEKASGLKSGKDFFLGYSPERINPGDKKHTFDKINKIVSGQDQQTLDTIAEQYGRVISAQIHKAPSIKVAEAAKVIENTQRDLNIALMNELAIIFNKLDISTHDVLEAAQTKWNFLPFTPGLVGGHCIGVDPYYLTYKAQTLGYTPKVILSGRETNDSMGRYIAEQTILMLAKHSIKNAKAKVGILGFTFKENCNDIRNTKVIDVINNLHENNVQTMVYDPIADKRETMNHYGIELKNLREIQGSDIVIICVAHDEFKSFTLADLKKLIKNKGIIFDIKNTITNSDVANQLNLWKL